MNKTRTIHLEPQYLNMIKDIAAKNPPISQIILYGSRARGDHRKVSDIDLCIFGAEKYQAQRLKAFFNEESNIPYLIDICEFETISNPRLKAEIERDGIVIYP